MTAAWHGYGVMRLPSSAIASALPQMRVADRIPTREGRLSGDAYAAGDTGKRQDEHCADRPIAAPTPCYCPIAAGTTVLLDSSPESQWFGSYLWKTRRRYGDERGRRTVSANSRAWLADSFVCLQFHSHCILRFCLRRFREASGGSSRIGAACSSEVGSPAYPAPAVAAGVSPASPASIMSSPDASAAPAGHATCDPDDVDVGQPGKRGRCSSDSQAAAQHLDADEKGSAAAISATQSTSHPVLYTHALESVFAFCNLSILSKLMRVSRTWLAAVLSMRRIDNIFIQLDDSLQADLSHPLPFGSSRLLRHVSTLRFKREFAIPHQRVAQVVQMFPSLTELECSLDLTDQPLVFPPTLRVLAVDGLHSDRAPHVNVFMRAVGLLTSLVELHIEKLPWSSALSFEPLAALTQLSELDFQWTEPDESELSDEQVVQLRALTWLDALLLPMTTEQMARLLRTPHALQWKQFHVFTQLGDEELALHLQLPSLTQLSSESFTCTHFDFLPRMPNLLHLAVGFDESMADSPPSLVDSLVANIRRCPQLTLLDIGDELIRVDSNHLASILPALTQLKHLRLRHAHLPTLAFLSQPSLACTLEELTILDAQEPKPPASEFSLFHSLKALICLDLDNVFATRVEGRLYGPLEPPSDILPKLETFTFTQEDQ